LGNQTRRATDGFIYKQKHRIGSEIIPGGQYMSTNPYDMGKPTEKDLLVALEKVMGAEKAREVLREARSYCADYTTDNALPTLTEIVTCLSKRKGLASVVGRSMLIRIKFYDSIYKKYEYA
jgi:hypothetical protein